MGNHRTMTRLCLTGAFLFAFLAGAAAYAGTDDTSARSLARIAPLTVDPP